MAAKRLVICVNCGKQFDANRGGYYNKLSHRYICKSCGKQLKKQNSKSSDNSKSSLGKTIAKIAIGLLFISIGFSSPDSGWSFSYFFTAFILGAALIVWGLMPFIKAKVAEKQEMKEEKEDLLQK